MASNVLRGFLKQFDEFIEDVIRVCPGNKRFLTCKMYFDGLKKSNPRIIITSWKSMVSAVYREQIESGDVAFFINKDYSDDTNWVSNVDAVTKGIEEIRMTVSSFSDENKIMAMKYVQNLLKLSDMY